MVNFEPCLGLSFLEQMAVAIGYRADSEIVMMWAYFDESLGIPSSETPERRSVVLGGSVARFEDWCRLLPKWQSIVESAGQKWFHATEWQQYEEQLKEPWERLAELANEHVIAHIGCTVPAHQADALERQRRTQHRSISRHEDDRDIASLERPWIAFMYDPLAVCLAWCLVRLSEVTEKTIHFVFAKRDKVRAREAKFLSMLEMLEGRPWSNFGTKTFDGEPKDLIQLQVADLVAFELTSYLHRWPVRAQYQTIRRKLRHYMADPPLLPSPLIWHPGVDLGYGQETEARAEDDPRP